MTRGRVAGAGEDDLLALAPLVENLAAHHVAARLWRREREVMSCLPRFAFARVDDLPVRVGISTGDRLERLGRLVAVLKTEAHIEPVRLLDHRHRSGDP